MADDDGFGLAGGAGGVDGVGGVGRIGPQGPEIGRRGGGRLCRQGRQQQHLGRQRRLDPAGGDRVDDDGGGGAIAQAFRHPFGGGVGVEWNIGGAGTQDSQQRHVQVKGARHPQADEGATADSLGGQGGGDAVGAGGQFAVGHRRLAERGGGGVGEPDDRGGEDFGQKLVAQEGRVVAAKQGGGQGRRELVHDVLKWPVSACARAAMTKASSTMEEYQATV